MPQKILTISIAAYNVESYIGKTLDSLLCKKNGWISWKYLLWMMSRQMKQPLLRKDMRRGIHRVFM